MKNRQMLSLTAHALSLLTPTVACAAIALALVGCGNPNTASKNPNTSGASQPVRTNPDDGEPVTPDGDDANGGDGQDQSTDPSGNPAGKPPGASGSVGVTATLYRATYAGNPLIQDVSLRLNKGTVKYQNQNYAAFATLEFDLADNQYGDVKFSVPLYVTGFGWYKATYTSDIVYVPALSASPIAIELSLGSLASGTGEMNPAGVGFAPARSQVFIKECGWYRNSVCSNSSRDAWFSGMLR